MKRSTEGRSSESICIHKRPESQCNQSCKRSFKMVAEILQESERHCTMIQGFNTVRQEAFRVSKVINTNSHFYAENKQHVIVPTRIYVKAGSFSADNVIAPADRSRFVGAQSTSPFLSSKRTLSEMTTDRILLRPRPYARSAGALMLLPLLPTKTPVRPLPVEIWTRIFAYVLKGDPDNVFNFESRLVLLLVCKTFKVVVIFVFVS